MLFDSLFYFIMSTMDYYAVRVKRLIVHHVQFSRGNTYEAVLVDIGERSLGAVDEYETFLFSEPGRPGCTYKNAKRPTSGWLLDKLGY